MPDNKEPVLSYHKCSQYPIAHNPNIDCLCASCENPRCTECEYRASLLPGHCNDCIKFARDLIGKKLSKHNKKTLSLLGLKESESVR